MISRQRFDLKTLILALLLIVFSTMLFANTVQAQTSVLTDEQLLRRAVAAMDENDFLTAAMFLQAYVHRYPAPMRNDAKHAQQVDAALSYSIRAVQAAMDCRRTFGVECNVNSEGLLVSRGSGLFQQPEPIVINPPQIDIPSSNTGNTTPSTNQTPSQSAEATVLFDGDPNSNRRRVNATFCSGFDSECNFGNCPKNYKLVWGPYCRASDYAYIQPGAYRVTLSGTGTVFAGATDYGTFFNLYGFGRHTITLPGSYTFCWPGRAPGGYGFETVVQAQSTSDRITNIRIEYLGACQ